MKELLFRCFDVLPEMGKIISIFEQNPLLETLSFHGRLFEDDHEILPEVNKVLVNGWEFAVEEDWEENGAVVNLPEFKWVESLLWDWQDDPGKNLMHVVGQHEVTDDIIIEFSRLEVEKSKPYYNILFNLYEMIYENSNG